MSNLKNRDSKRILYNTLFLYIRMFLLIVVQLYTVPIILESLGLSDYGLYNVVGGVVTMFSFIGGSLMSGSQRFMAFAIGKKDKKELNAVFATTLTIYLLFAIIALFLLESLGLWFLNTQMNIPADRMYAANWVLQFSILTFFINLLSIPYNAAVIAHERMSLFAYVSILECVLKLVAAIILQQILYDKLIAYSFLICVIAILIRVIYQIYCKKNFEECRTYKFSWDMNIGRELLTYSGWNVIGSIALLLRQHGLNIVINLFFGTLLNAAHSIAQNVNGVINQLIVNLYMATRPQITKLYANNCIPEMWNIVYRSTKLSFFLLIYLCIPLLLEIETVFTFWLGDFPRYTIAISRILIITILIESLGNQIIAAFQAANKIRKYQIFSSTILLLNIPIAYLVLKIFPESPLLPYFMSILLSILYVLSILVNAKKEISMNLKQYFKEVVMKVFFVFGLTFTFVGSIVFLSPSSIYRTVTILLATIIISSITIWYMGLDNVERSFVKHIIKQKMNRDE